MAKDGLEQYFDAVTAELNRERAAVLGRAGRRVEKAQAACEISLAELDAVAGSGEEHAAALADYRSARRALVHARADLCLQREVLGLLDHRGVDEVYPLPPPR